ncbi:hypothetical protein GCM10009576_099590 [Streptomyces rhizosphaericus]|uniref:Uncharacterized protein n=1 Tax=Streptomyces rhizosphaericus TaxID=114699 RepID=A0ABN1TDV2_9ACTN
MSVTFLFSGIGLAISVESMCCQRHMHFFNAIQRGRKSSGGGLERKDKSKGTGG